VFVAHARQVEVEEDNIIRPDRETLISKNMNATQQVKTRLGSLFLGDLKVD
jgi:hypothetical protein